MGLIAEWKAKRANATVTLATPATHGGKTPRKTASSPATVAAVATVTVTSTQKTAPTPAPTPPAPPPDLPKATSYTWPNSPAMNAAEVAQAAQRHARLVAGGMTELEADGEVDRLLLAGRAGVATPTPTAQTTAPRKLYPCAASRPEWMRADRIWQTHHFQCPACIAAGHGRGLRCPDGLALLEAVP